LSLGRTACESRNRVCRLRHGGVPCDKLGSSPTNLRQDSASSRRSCEIRPTDTWNIRPHGRGSRCGQLQRDLAVARAKPSEPGGKITAESHNVGDRCRAGIDDDGLAPGIFLFVELIQPLDHHALPSLAIGRRNILDIQTTPDLAALVDLGDGIAGQDGRVGQDSSSSTGPSERTRPGRWQSPLVLPPGGPRHPGAGKRIGRGSR